jgi:hypothetical protein
MQFASEKVYHITEEDETYFNRLCFSDEATFHVYETGTVYGEMKILMMLMNMSVIHQRWTLMKDNIINSFFLVKNLW